MTTAFFATLIAYAATSFSAFVLLRRGSNRRLRFLTFVIGLLPLCQIVVLLQNKGLLINPSLGAAAETVELMIGAMCLAAVHFLNEERRDRNRTDAKLRLAETAFSSTGRHRISGDTPMDSISPAA